MMARAAGADHGGSPPCARRPHAPATKHGHRQSVAVWVSVGSL